MTIIQVLAFVVICVSVSSFRSSMGLRISRKATILKMSADVGQSGLRVAVTRELGTNFALLERLSGLECFELPCIYTEPIWGAGEVAEKIREHDYVLITSPHAAMIYNEAWKDIGSPADVKVASVGDGTTTALKSFGITPAFQPSEATGEALATELPLSLGLRALYPCSQLANTWIEEILTERGFAVTRLETYTTLPAKHWTAAMTKLAKTIQVATFASPSAIHHWANKVGTDAKAVVIGPTTAAEARRVGFKEVYAPPESGGLEPFAELIREVALGKV